MSSICAACSQFEATSVTRLCDSWSPRLRLRTLGMSVRAEPCLMRFLDWAMTVHQLGTVADWVKMQPLVDGWLELGCPDVPKPQPES